MIPKSYEKFGTALFGLEELSKISRLWEGPLSPMMLESIETTLRGFITAKKLATLRQANDLYDFSDEMDWRSATHDEYFTPFEDHLLDYEFVDPEFNVVVDSLGVQESDYLSEYVSSIIYKEIIPYLSNLKINLWQADRYVRMWYRSGSPEACLYYALNFDELDYKADVEILKSGGDDYPTRPFDSDKGPSQLVSLMYIFEHAKYLVSTHRTGFQVYSSNSLTRICEQHIFSAWPNKIFEEAALNYQELSRELRGYGQGFDLPMITAIVLSRAKTRELIPQTIVDLREEYERARTQLWDLLIQMWTEKTLAQQKNILNELQAASQSIFPAAFPERYDVLSLALDISQLSLGGITSGLKEIRKRDLPNVRVSAVTFAKKLSKELRNNLMNTRQLLDRHLTNAERRYFGML